MRWAVPGARGFLLAGGLMAAAYFAVPDSLLRAAIFTALSAAPVVAVVVGVRRHRPDRALPWALFAAGLAAFSVGNAIWYGAAMGFGNVESPPLAANCAT